MPRNRQGVLLGADRPAAPVHLTGVPGAARAEDRPAPEVLPLPTNVTLPAHFFPPAYGAQGFFPIGSIALAATGLQAVPNTKLTLQPGFVGIVRSIALALSNTLTTTDVGLQLYVNGAPMAPVRKLPSIAAASLTQEWDSYTYVVPPGATVELWANVIDAGSYPLTASYDGWSLSVQDWNRLRGILA